MNRVEFYKLIWGTAFVVLNLMVFIGWSSDVSADSVKAWLYWIDLYADHHHSPTLYLPMILK